MTLAVRMLRDRHDAEEALQDAFVRAFRALPSFQWQSRFSTWFYRIVYNVCLNRLSAGGRNDVRFADGAVDAVAEEELPADEPGSDGMLEHRELDRIVREEIGRMEPAYAAVLTMFVLHEMSYQEIMSVTGLPLGTVKNRLFRARRLLRTALARQAPEWRTLERS